jgi:hypothetical protein
LLKITHTSGTLSFFFGFTQSGQNHTRQNCDDRNNHQQLYESKGIVLFDCLLEFIIHKNSHQFAKQRWYTFSVRTSRGGKKKNLESQLVKFDPAEGGVKKRFLIFASKLRIFLIKNRLEACRRGAFF